jgi:hypothetical protein
MIEHDEEGLSRLLRTAIGPVGESPLRRDLWPDVVQRIRYRPRLSRVDGALLAASLVLGPLFPRSVLFLLYSL